MSPNIQEISKTKDSFSLKELNVMLKKKNKSIPTKFLYDDLGSKLFEKISNTKEYYLTRTEENILNKYSTKIINESDAHELLELGSGSSKKTKLLILEALKVKSNLSYVSFDISEKALKMSYNQLNLLKQQMQ